MPHRHGQNANAQRPRKATQDPGLARQGKRIMANCESYQAQLLGYLYDLLEPEEQQALREHLNQCPACQLALREAERQKKLLAAAAKAEFAGVRFEPPPAGEARAKEEVPAVPIAFRRTPWFRWGIAASILLLVGLGIPVGIWGWHYSEAQQTLQALALQYRALQAQDARLHEDQNAASERAQQEAREIQEQIRKLAESRTTKLAAFQKVARERQLNITVTGPQTLQPGAPNQYQVATRNRNHQPVPAQLAVRVLDGQKRVVYEQQDVRSTGQWNFALPANLPVPADSKLSLEVVARQEGGREEQIREELALAAPVYLTHLTTDKPMYRPGETVHFRSLTLERFRLKPPEEDFHLVYTLTKPTGEEMPVLAGSPLLFDEKTQSPLLGPDKKPI